MESFPGAFLLTIFAVPSILLRTQTLRPSRHPPEPLHILPDGAGLPPQQPALPAPTRRRRRVVRAAPAVQQQRRTAGLLCAAGRDKDASESGGNGYGDADVQWGAAGGPAERCGGREWEWEWGCGDGADTGVAAAATGCEGEDYGRVG